MLSEDDDTRTHYAETLGVLAKAQDASSAAP
jgi:hypothetical protein